MLKLAWLQELAVAADDDDDSQLLGRALEEHARAFTAREFALPIRALEAM